MVALSANDQDQLDVQNTPAVYTARWLIPAETVAITDAWRDLEKRAIEPNVFHGPDFLPPCLASFTRGARLIVVESSQYTGTRKLVAIVPVVSSRFGFGIVGPVPSIFSGEYGPLGTPLIDRTDPVGVCACLLEGLATRGALIGFSNLRLDGAVFDAIRRATVGTGGTIRILDRRRRAAIDLVKQRPLGQPGHPKRRKEWNRLGRRLEESGALVIDELTAVEDVVEGFEQYIQLEAQGWKGRGGSALRQQPRALVFVRAAIRSLAAHGQATIDRMTLDGKPIAFMVRLSSGAGSWIWKTTFAEHVADYSPGVLVTLKATERLLANPNLSEADSLAVEGHPMIDHIWSDRTEIGTAIVVFGAQQRRAAILAADFALHASTRTAVRNALKWLRLKKR